MEPQGRQPCGLAVYGTQAGIAVTPQEGGLRHLNLLERQVWEVVGWVRHARTRS